MIQHIIDFPSSARVDRIISKKKIYDKSDVTNRVKKIFIDKIEQVRWLYKLSPETINIPATETVQELQVFYLRLKKSDKTEDILIQIDKSIPSPILFILQFEKRIRYVASYKRPNQADHSKWVTSEYFSSGWIPESSDHKPLPVTINMEAIYHHFLRWLIPIKMRKNEDISSLVQRAELLRIKEREHERLNSKLHKEKQFNRKVEINTELKTISAEINRLSLLANSNT